LYLKYHKKIVDVSLLRAKLKFLYNCRTINPEFFYSNINMYFILNLMDEVFTSLNYNYRAEVINDLKKIYQKCMNYKPNVNPEAIKNTFNL
jgi:hypothetical protein